MQNMNQEGMTNEQFKIFLKMIIEILELSETKEDAIDKIKSLLND